MNATRRAIASASLSGVVTVALAVALTVALTASLVACDAEAPEQSIAADKAEPAHPDHSAALVRLRTALQQAPQSAQARYLLGRTLLESGDAEGAVAELSKALDQQAPPEQVAPLLADALLTLGEHRRLVAAFADRRLDDPEATAALQAAVATAWSALGNLAKSRQASAAALAAAPDHQAVRLLKARLTAGSGDFAGALAQARQIVADDATRHDAWLLQGELQSRLGDGRSAEFSVRQSIGLQPAYAPAQLALVDLLLQRPDLAGAKAALDGLKNTLPNHPATLYAEAQVALTAGDLGRARDLAQQLLRMAPDNVDVLLVSGVVASRVGLQALAETQLSKALRIDPELKQGRLVLARVYMGLGQAGKALDTLRPIVGMGAGGVGSGDVRGDAEAHALAGDAQLRLGDIRAAAVHFRRAAELEPADDRHAVAVALSQMADRGADATFETLQALSAKSKSTQADLAIVSARMRRGDFDAALAALDAVARKQPGSAGLSVMRGRVQMARKDLAAARSDFEQALKLDPAGFEAASSLAGIELLQGDADAAQHRLRVAVQADPQNPLARSALARLQERTGAPADEVLRTLEAAVQASPGAATPRILLIELLLRQQRVKAALAAARDAASALPNDTPLLATVGRAQEAANELEQALSTYRRLSSLLPAAASPWLRLADIYRASGRPDAAESALRRALEIEPELGPAQRQLLDLLLQQERGDDALKLAQAEQRRRPQSASGYLLEGVTAMRTGADAAAVAVLRKGLAAVPDSSVLARALYSALVSQAKGKPAGLAEAERQAAQWLKAHPQDIDFEHVVAISDLGRGAYAAAETRLQRVLQQQPDHAQVLNHMAWSLAKQGKPAALGFAQRAVDASPRQPYLLDTLALALAVSGQHDKAFDTQQQAMALAPSEPSLRLGLVQIALQSGDMARARRELETLKALGPSFNQQPEVSRLLARL